MPAEARPVNEAAARFYEQALTEAERADFPVALSVEGLDQEIALLRLRLRAEMSGKRKLDRFLKGVELLIRAAAARYKLGPGSAEQLERSLRAVLSGMKELEAGDDQPG